MNYNIKAVQLDVNGLCNAGCWYCPVSYAGNPKSAIRDMTLDEIENIFKQLTDAKGKYVDKDLDVIYSANYNEVLLYKDLPGMFDLYRKYNFKTNILSNGISLTKDKVDLLLDYSDVINGILLNIPSADPEKWSKYVNKNIKIFDKVISNVKYLVESFGSENNLAYIHLMINGVNNQSLTKNGGWLDLLDNAPEIDLNSDLDNEIIAFKSIFPGLDMSTAHHLYDRAGHLEKYGIITQAPAISKYLKEGNTKVIGCNGGLGVRSRTNEWIHINPNGDLFICCADYDFETVYGNINEKSLYDIWNSVERKNMITQSYSDMCTRCSAAIWGN